jgi:Escherichia/Staphylococcus phage prohead protease
MRDDALARSPDLSLDDPGNTPGLSEDDMKQLEYRAVAKLEIREEGGKPKLVGYAAVFNSRSVDLGGFVEVIRPGAFKRSLAAGADVRALVEHDPGRIIARGKAGNLSLAEDDRGLKVEIMPTDTSAGRDAIENVRSGVLDAMSFGFYVQVEKWDFKTEPALRELYDVEIDDVSIVAYPAYPKTEIALRSLESAKGDLAKVLAEQDARARRLRLLERGA